MSQHSVERAILPCMNVSHACKNCRLVDECSALYNEVAEPLPKGDAPLAFHQYALLQLCMVDVEEPETAAVLPRLCFKTSVIIAAASADM